MALSHRLRQIVDASLADLIEDWHDFDLMVGTAAATLVGLMFVAASIGASIYTEKNRPGMQAFISPTVVHFTSVLVLALFALVPTHEWLTLAGLLALVGAAGGIYSANLGRSCSSGAASTWTLSTACSTRRFRCWVMFSSCSPRSSCSGNRKQASISWPPRRSRFFSLGSAMPGT
jgi:hypothetical protein